MSKSALIALLVALLVALPGYADEQEEEPSVAGVWLVDSVEMDGETIDDDIETRIVVFTEQGQTRVYNTTEGYEEGRPDEGGWYEFGEPGMLVLYEDNNENGVLDDIEQENPKPLGWVMEDERLVLIIRDGDAEGALTIRIILTPYE